jgi:hypothetical protein
MSLQTLAVRGLARVPNAGADATGRGAPPGAARVVAALGAGGEWQPFGMATAVKAIIVATVGADYVLPRGATAKSSRLKPPSHFSPVFEKVMGLSASESIPLHRRPEQPEAAAAASSAPALQWPKAPPLLMQNPGRLITPERELGGGPWAGRYARPSTRVDGPHSAPTGSAAPGPVRRGQPGKRIGVTTSSSIC